MKSPFARNLLILAAAEAAASTGAAQPTTGPVPDSNAPGAEAVKKVRAPKNPDNQLNIINGRLPLVLVALIRFKETGKPVAEVAKKYGTSVGKVFDINKGRNFAYVDSGYKPSAEEAKAGMDWCDAGKTAKGQTLKEAGGDPDGIKSMITAMGTATAEEVAKRNWTTRVIGAKAAAGTAPVATGAAPAAAAATDKTAGQGAKLF